MSEPTQQNDTARNHAEDVAHKDFVPAAASETSADALTDETATLTQIAPSPAEPQPAQPTTSVEAYEAVSTQDAAPVLSVKELEQKTHAADAQVLADSRQHTRRSFLVAAAAVGAGAGLWRYVNTAPVENMQPMPLEDAYKINAAVSRAVLPGEALAPTYPLSRAETLRINGIYGLKKDIVPESWRLQLVGMQDAGHHPRFVPDVTAWEYQYMAPPANEDKGHDTKVDPAKEAAVQAAAAPAPQVENSQSAVAPGLVMSGKGKADPTMMSSIKMAPESMLQSAMKQESGAGDDDDNAVDDNHTGRKARGREEAGESDSTLPPHTPGLLLQLADITRLPRHEMVTQFKCIEGWSQIVHWAGVRMADFLELYPPALIDGKEPRFVYMETPDGDYYTGYDLEAMRHPQTLLVTEMMGRPLTQNHGAPLRLHMPIKYGYKQIKRIGLIAYTNTRPDDYWTKLGYDWYAGL